MLYRLRYLVVCAVVFPVATNLSGQTIQGRTLDKNTSAPVSTTLVRLLSHSGDLIGVAISDMAGFYSLHIPEPGIYQIKGERLGYTVFETPSFEVVGNRGLPPLNLMLDVSPVLIESLVVSTQSYNQRIRSLIDARLDLLKYSPIQLNGTQRRIGLSRHSSDILGWLNPHDIVVSRPSEGAPCFPLKSRDCLALYLSDIQFSGELFDGPYERYDEDGRLQASGTYKDGKVDGRWEEYYESGRLKTKGTMRDGEPDGPYERYDEDGRLQASGTIRHGELDGVSEEYYESGQLKTRRTYRHGELDGVSEEYHESGQLKTKGTYKAGIREGLWEEYHENGQLKTKRTYGR